MILAKDGIIESATEPVKNRRKYWFNSTNKKMYELDTEGKYQELKQTIDIQLGVEYETGRVIGGKKEYAKRIRCGDLPNNNSLVIETGLSDVTFTKAPEGFAQYEDVANNSNTMPLPYIDPRDPSASISLAIISGFRIAIVTCQDRSNLIAIVTVFYVKD